MLPDKAQLIKVSDNIRTLRGDGVVESMLGGDDRLVTTWFVDDVESFSHLNRGLAFLNVHHLFVLNGHGDEGCHCIVLVLSLDGCDGVLRLCYIASDNVKQPLLSEDCCHPHHSGKPVAVLQHLYLGCMGIGSDTSG